MSSGKNDTRTRILAATWHLMDQRCGHGVRMSDIAKEAGVSRQAVYLHFKSRTDLMIATTRYVDEVKGLNERLKRFKAATSGIDLLEECIDVWGNYIPEVYGIARALINTRETDEATAAAWNGCMEGLRHACREVIDALDQDGVLAGKWSGSKAVDMLWAMLSIQHWEQLTIECGWSNSQYISWMKLLLKRCFVDETKASS